MKKCAKLKEDLLHDEIRQVYGDWASELIEKFSQLDRLDQIKIMERMVILLENEKYSNRKRIRSRVGNSITVDFSSRR